MHLGNTIFQKREQSCSREESEKDQMRVTQKMSSDAQILFINSVNSQCVTKLAHDWPGIITSPAKAGWS
ncbi:TPA: hypothetical protein JBD73_11475 [Legionella pneumophila subsp. pneumophila]|nr:hypothetical protein [Legionella pneumophila subsp. pneumophila]